MVVALVLQALPAIADTGPFESMVFGAGIGGIRIQPTTAGSHANGLTGNIFVGSNITSHLWLRLEGNAWVKQFDNNLLEFGSKNGPRWTSASGTLELCYSFSTSGLSVRGGMGLGRVHIVAGGLDVTESETTTGISTELGASYEFRCTTRLSVGPQIDFRYQSLRQPGGLNMFSAGLGVSWR